MEQNDELESITDEIRQLESEIALMGSTQGQEKELNKAIQ